MKSLVLTLSFFISLAACSQHYYNDITGSLSWGERMKTYAANKVKGSTATGYDPQGSRSTDFNEWQEVDASARVLKITTRTGQSVNRQYYQFNEQYLLTGIMDSSASIKSTTVYAYNTSQQLTLVKTVVTDSLNDFSETEEHQWIYNTAGHPEKMWRILNGKDSTEYRFTTDEKGNVADEQLFRRNAGFDQVYYYYDENKQLTDIVRFDKKAGQLLPDFMFEYDENGRVIQKITTLSTASRDYLIWRYLYNEKGLKTKEALFNKQKELTGRIEYAYTFLP